MRWMPAAGAYAATAAAAGNKTKREQKAGGKWKQYDNNKNENEIRIWENDLESSAHRPIAHSMLGGWHVRSIAFSPQCPVPTAHAARPLSCRCVARKVVGIIVYVYNS